MKEIVAEVGEEIVETITFANPFKKNVFVYIFLESEKEGVEECFKLVTKNNKCQLDYLQEI